MGWRQWCALAQRVEHHLARSDVPAVVVTHGTDTLEETAFFLSRVLDARLLRDKAVILTCAMRPASSTAPDGPQNVLDAVSVARSGGASGVLAVCAGTIHCARDVQKVHPYRLNAFDSGEAGPLGFVEENRVRWVHPCPVLEAPVSGASVQRMSSVVWPRVEIVMNYVGATGATVRALCAVTAEDDELVRGFVVAGTGNGTVHEDLLSALREAQARGIAVVRATRCAQGGVVPSSAIGELPDSQGLSPIKARIELALGLIKKAADAALVKTASPA
jgi:L-asparaginase